MVNCVSVYVMVNCAGVYILWLTVCELVGYLLIYVTLKNFSLIWRIHHCWWRAAKFRPMLGAQGIWAGGSLSCHTCCSMGSWFFLSHLKESLIQSPLTTRMGMQRTYSKPDPHGAKLCVSVYVMVNCVFVCLFVYSFTSNFSAIWRLSPLPVKGLQI
jgi:hypothetical protein